MIRRLLTAQIPRTVLVLTVEWNQRRIAYCYVTHRPHISPCLAFPLLTQPGASIYLLHLVPAPITRFSKHFLVALLYASRTPSVLCVPSIYTCLVFSSLRRQFACVCALEKRFKSVSGLP